MSKNPSREEALFADALAQPPAQREAYLAQACGADGGLLARVVNLVAAHEGPDSLLATRDNAALHIAVIPEEKPGDLIGRYKLVRKIGEGGCGVVYLAEQEQPVRRQVAVKVIKAGMDTREVIARFSAERQALALMDHPGICKVLDAGATEAGRAFFAMEFVPGEPITKFCDGQNLSTTARLRLFIQICHAVQHAHQKGVIHRDLKPSNLLVSGQDGTASPKVIDFGIAKAIQGRLADTSLVTTADLFIGTPAYMAPEQADPGEADIDTRSDVYSLGVVLYELLSGRLPFDPKSLGHASRDELRRILREVEPPKPSLRFATLAAADRVPVARSRGTEPARLSDTLSGDLDWIVMKALEKDRDRRYETPMALADDLARHLNHEPVMARPAGARYRAGKFIRRHRVGVAAAAGVALALVLGTAISTRQAVRAIRAEQLADAQRRSVLAERARAEELLEFIVSDLRPTLKSVGQLAILEATASKALAYFADRNLHEPEDGDIARHAKALLLLGELRVDQARYAEAEQTFTNAVGRAELLVRRTHGSAEARSLQGQAEGWMAIVMRRLGKMDSANEWCLRQEATAGSLVAEFPDSLRWQRELSQAQHSLAGLAFGRGQFDQARESFLRESATLTKLSAAAPGDLEIKAQHADVISFLGSIAERSGNLDEAARRHENQVERLAEIVRADPQGKHWRFKLAESSSFHASILGLTGRRPAALKIIAEARNDMEQLVAHDPTSRRWLGTLLTIKLREGMLAHAVGQAERARQSVEEARQGFDQLGAAEPGDRLFAARRALACRLSAELRHAAGESDAAAIAARAVELGATLVGKSTHMTPERGEYANACIIAGRIAAERGDTDAARGHWQRGLELLAPHVAGARDWRVLDPAARLALHLDRRDEGHELVRQLDGLGYVPLQPWPAF